MTSWRKNPIQCTCAYMCVCSYTENQKGTQIKYTLHKLTLERYGNENYYKTLIITI